MSPNKTYSKKEISKILAKASEIQVKKDLYEDQDTLSEEDLIHIAEEVGISKDTLKEALFSFESFKDTDHAFSWTKATNKIQDISVFDGSISEENWEKVVQEIRRVTGGIGRTYKVGESYEWEQRRQDFSYKHISLLSQNTKTKIQFVNKWIGIRRISLLISFIIPFAITAISLDGSGLSEIPSILISLGGGLLGVPFGLIYLKSYFKKQKDQAKKIFMSIKKEIKGSSGPAISIGDQDVYQNEDLKLAKNVKRKST